VGESGQNKNRYPAFPKNTRRTEHSWWTVKEGVKKEKEGERLKKVAWAQRESLSKNTTQQKKKWKTRKRGGELFGPGKLITRPIGHRGGFSRECEKRRKGISLNRGGQKSSCSGRINQKPEEKVNRGSCSPRDTKRQRDQNERKNEKRGNAPARYKVTSQTHRGRKISTSRLQREARGSSTEKKHGSSIARI